MDKTGSSTIKQITYWNCNKHSIILMGIIVPTLIITGLIVKLFVYSQYNRISGVCNPIDFYWGNKKACRKFVSNIVKNTISTDKFVGQREQVIVSDGAVTAAKTEPVAIGYLSTDFIKKTLLANYLAIIDFIHSFDKLMILIGFKLYRIAMKGFSSV